MQYPEDDAILAMMLSDASRDEGFRMFVNKYKERLYFMIRRMVENHEDADDVIQNTFLKVVRHIQSFNGESNLFTWVYRIATNECLNFLDSRRKRGLSFSLEAVAETAESPLPPDGDSIVASLQHAVQSLPEKQKMIFNLRYYESLPYADIAEITGTSVGALKASYHHAVKKIEEQITR
jgi:RNA polymerase sigma factor (sigma-70 family)